MNIEQLRAAMQSAGAEWEAAEEPLNVETRLGYLPSRGVPPLHEQERIAATRVEEALGAAAPAYPSAYDLRNVGGSNFITPIRDQGGCGSCVAFGSCAAVEGTLRVQQRDPSLDVDLSEAHLFYCVALAQGRHCLPPDDGWYPKEALDTFQNQGVPDEACFPYTPGDQQCAECSDWQRRATGISSWHSLDTSADMKTWISSQGPVVASMAVYEDFQHYAGGVYRHVAGAKMGGHCVSIVGYDDGDGYWIVKNSWDTGWGEAGFFRIAYGQCGIDSAMLAVEGVVPAGQVRSSS